MAPDSVDELVALAALTDDRILISWDKDFNGQRFRQDRFKTLSRLALSCNEVEAVGRMKDLIDLVEYEWQSRRTKRLARIIVHVSADQIRFRH